MAEVSGYFARARESVVSFMVLFYMITLTKKISDTSKNMVQFFAILNYLRCDSAVIKLQNFTHVYYILHLSYLTHFEICGIDQLGCWM